MTPTQDKCLKLFKAYANGQLGNTKMPEDAHPSFEGMSVPAKFAYFTLPMSLNYQRDSYKLWEAATKTFLDNNTAYLFDVSKVSIIAEETIRKDLLKYKLALQPNKHINTWIRISNSFLNLSGDIPNFFNKYDNDVLQIKNVIQKNHKNNFPYLSGPKFFNYWLYIIERYCYVKLTNRDFIEIAPDTHVIQASIKLGILDATQKDISREKISEIWRATLNGTGISPIDMHSPLWFWSRSVFEYEV